MRLRAVLRPHADERAARTDSRGGPEVDGELDRCAEGDGGYCGWLCYHHREPWHRRLEIGFILAPSYWRPGLMSDAMRSLVASRFKDLDTHRVEATIQPENVASIRLAERLGFRWEGVLRDSLARRWHLPHRRDQRALGKRVPRVRHSHLIASGAPRTRQRQADERRGGRAMMRLRRVSRRDSTLIRSPSAMKTPTIISQ